jgi:RNA polymerase sigma factor (sigma-70 family)
MDIRQEQRDDEQDGEAPGRDDLARQAQRVRELLGELGDEEREIVRLRFEEGWTAQRIAKERGLRGQRRVYTILDGAIRKLRRKLEDR